MAGMTFDAFVCHDDHTFHVRIEAGSREEARRLVRAQLDADDGAHYEIRWVEQERAA